MAAVVALRSLAAALLALSLTGLTAPAVAGSAAPHSGDLSYAPVPGAQFRSILTSGNPRGAPVQVRSFSLEKTPVTNDRFLAFVRTHPEWRRSRAPLGRVDSNYLQHWRSDLELGSEALGSQPVTHVSWFAAQAFCRSQRARLPSWHEWELAAAADEHVTDARGDPAWRQRILAWYSRPSTRPLSSVGQDAANVYGVHDLHGLVWEWVEDFNALFIADDPQQANAEVLRLCGAGAGSVTDPESYAVMMRLAMLSSLTAQSTTANVGFRCALPAWESYHGAILLEAQDGHQFTFDAPPPRVRIVTMFYSSCAETCPLTIDTLRAIEQKLTPAQRAQLEILMITFDPEHDTRRVLKGLAVGRRLDTARWTLARAGLEDTRELSQILQIAYRKLDNGTFSHSSALVLMDRTGKSVARTTSIGRVDPQFLGAVRSVLDEADRTLTTKAQ